VKIAITLVAALLAGVGFVLQQHAAEQAPKSYFLRLRLITTLLHRPRWIIGVAVMAAGQLLSAWAIGHVALALAEPLLTSMTGVAAGLVFGIADGLTRRTVEIMGAYPVTALLTGWPLYCLVVTSLVGFWLMESSFNAAPLHASLPAITAAEPVAGILLGVVVFGDVVHLSPGMLALQAAGIVALVGGVILAARAPALSRLGRPAVLLQPDTDRSLARQATASMLAPARCPGARGSAVSRGPLPREYDGEPAELV
jgi:hypothetical protein